MQVTVFPVVQVRAAAVCAVANSARAKLDDKSVRVMVAPVRNRFDVFIKFPLFFSTHQSVPTLFAVLWLKQRVCFCQTDNAVN